MSRKHCRYCGGGPIDLAGHEENCVCRPVSTGIMIEDPDGALHGSGDIVASANAAQWRPQDFALVAREILFGDRLR